MLSIGMTDPVAAAALLADWGFLAEPDLPDRPGPAVLMVALRDRPTLVHYDPEVVEYWVTEHGRGARRTLTRETRLPLETDFSWGLIRIVDRLNVSNEYTTFGGHLSAADVDGLTAAVFASTAPLLRRGGHSQGWDLGAEHLAAFFGRLLLAVDYTPGFEGEAGSASPLAHYSAFVGDLLARYRDSITLRDQHHRLWQLIQGEARRLERDQPEAWAHGATLLARIKRA